MIDFRFASAFLFFSTFFVMTADKLGGASKGTYIQKNKAGMM